MANSYVAFSIRDRCKVSHYMKDMCSLLGNRLLHLGIRGFKRYHLLAHNKPARGATYKHGFAVTLYMVRDKALPDPINSKYIVSMAKKYSNAVLILAHAARNFAAWTAVEAVDTVKCLDNVWFDFPGVCESPAEFQIIHKCGVDRCMWGGDYPISRLAGKAISTADSFYWIAEKI